MLRRGERLGRSILSAGVSTLVTAAAHSLGGGVFPAQLLLALVYVVSVLLNFALLSRRFSLLRLIPAIGGTQLLLHAVFSIAGAGTGHGAVTESTSHHVMAGPIVVGSSPSSGEHHDGMMSAHVIAGLIAVASLRLGAGAVHRAMASLLMRVVASLSYLSRPVSPPRDVPLAAAQSPGAAGQSRLLTDLIVRRGPPSDITLA